MKTNEMIAKNKKEGQIMIYTCPACKKRFMVQDEEDIEFMIPHLLKSHTPEQVARWVPWSIDIVKLKSLEKYPKAPDKRFKTSKKVNQT